MRLPNTLKIPPFLQKLHWVRNPVSYMKSAAQLYPDVFTAEVVGFGDTLVFVQHLHAIQEMLARDRKQFAALATKNKILQAINYLLIRQPEWGTTNAATDR